VTEERFRLLANRLIRKNIQDRSERMAEVDRLVLEYVESAGEIPDSHVLDKLSDYILSEEIKDSNPSKMSRNEYPILSRSQRDLRIGTEVTLCLVREVVSSTDIELHRYEEPRKRLKAEINRETNHYKILNKSQPVTTRRMTEAESDYYSSLPTPEWAAYRGKDHIGWSLEVRRRDNFTCQKCGVHKQIGLHAHHIEAYNTAVELRNDINNGITLCRKCHRDFHATYGYGGNNHDQLQKWMEGDWLFE
jgi:hypothetical protein